MKEAIRYGFILMVISLVASGLLVGVNLLTGGRIKVQILKERNAAFKEVLPAAERFKPIEDSGEIVYYEGLDVNGKFIGAVFTTQGRGYSSTIETVVGMYSGGTISGIKIISQNETPGLGSRITEVKDETTLWDVFTGHRQTTVFMPWFQEEFSGKKVGQISEVEAITGATISSKAVIDSVKAKAEKIEKLIQEKRQ